MGRFYEISVSGTGSDAATTAALAATPVRRWTSVADGGGDNPGALNVQFDFFEYFYAIPMGNSTITIEGAALQDIQQAQQFAGMQITVKGGMSAGLPLANASQSGTILKGQIFQAFGNWIGTDMSLDFVVIPSIYSFDSPGNFVLNWKAGTPLAAALSTTLGIAYPGISRVVNIAQYVRAYDVVGYYHTLAQLAKFIKSVTTTPQSPGVDIAFLNNSTLLVSDGSVTGNVTQILFTDFVGQPTWIDQNIMQCTTVMRADIQVGGLVKMPQGLQDAPGIVTTTSSSLPSSLKYKTSFQGTFIVQSVRHVGNFRDANGSSWVTVFQCAVQPGTPSAASGAGVT